MNTKHETIRNIAPTDQTDRLCTSYLQTELINELSLVKNVLFVKISIGNKNTIAQRNYKNS